MPTLILAESGSTKTDWRIIRKGKVLHTARTSGINPYLQTEAEITGILKKEFAQQDIELPAKSEVIFYAAGVGTPHKQSMLGGILRKFFGTTEVTVHTDMLGAARALCGQEKGVVCILGTGSNSCYYDGELIADQHASLGYLAGDEGSGNHLGKKVLQYYAYKTFDNELTAAFEMEFGSDLGLLLKDLYGNPFPNRYLAGFVSLLAKNRGHFMVENILEDAFTAFFTQHIFKYRQSWKGPVHFTGSIAYAFRDVLTDMCQQYELEMGRIVQAPIEALVQYHKDAKRVA